MPLTPDHVESILANCRQNVGEAAQALARALGCAPTLTSDDIKADRFTGTLTDWNGPGLAVSLTFQGQGVLLLLPESSGLLPAWYHAPDATGVSKLNTLAQELGLILIPEEFQLDSYAAKQVPRLLDAVVRGGASIGAALIRLELQGTAEAATLYMLWPLPRPEAVFASAKNDASTEASARPHDDKRRLDSEEELEEKLQKLPPYVRSLLRIRVPVSVLLASTKQPVSRILNIGPGSIIQFEKHCEQPLTLCIGGQMVAEGEAVKVGEKFGIKITSMVLPGERFFALRGKRDIRRMAHR
jgi:flagellar motor switch protein FliN/FliY